MLVERKHCAKAHQNVFHHDKKNVSFFSGLVLALLPKCPFCFMAFSSTVFLCDEAGTSTSMQMHTSSTSVWISIIFCAIILAGIFFNYRDKRTIYAFALASAGALCILLSLIKAGGSSLYYLGLIIIFIGVWLNGSLLFFVRAMGKYFSKTIDEQHG